VAFTNVAAAWRRSLILRSVVLTVAVTALVVGVAGAVLTQRISTGLDDAKVRRALAEAAAGRSIARSAAQGAVAGETSAEVIDRLVAELSRRAGKPPAFEVILVPQPDSGDPGGSTSLVDPSAVPADLEEALQQRRKQTWTEWPIEYSDGRVVNGLIVGGPASIRGIGRYDLYYLFPLSATEQTVSLVRSAIIGVGVALIFTLGLLSLIFTRRLLVPVQQAANTANALADGELDRRLVVRGEDDLAVLAKAFNTMADSLSDQIVRLEALSDMQRRFVSDVSHELRTPLTTIKMAADVAGDRSPPGDAAAQRAAELLQSEVERFETLLSDLLEISRFDAGAAVLEPDDVDLVALIAELVSQVSPLALDRGTVIEVESDEPTCLAFCDGRRVSRVLRNLVVNAIEYGGGRPVLISLACDSEAVTLGVRDFGAGLSPADREHVFERFWRADPSRVRTLGGTGLGLAISREDAQLHGGTLDVEAADPGCSFVLQIPRKAD
jgi:two-component system sensor histidine kinase MtrB